MKTLHTIYTNFAKRFVMSLMLLMTIGVTAVLGDDNAFIDIYRSSNPLIYTTTPTVVETGKPVRYYFTGESQQSSDQGLDWQNGVSLTLEVPNDYSISKVIVVPYASSSIGDIVLVSDVVGSISRESQFVWTASDLVNQSIQEIVLKQSSSNGQKTRIKSISVTYQSSSMHTITWKVDGETYTEGNPSYAVAHGEKVNKLPTSPTSLPCDGKTFIGWAEENDYENYFYDVPSSPVIEESKTFHAVFASVAQAGGNSKTETLNGSDLVYSGNSGYVNFTAQTSSGMLWTGKANYNTSGYIQINKNSKNYHIGSPTFAGNVESIKIITTNNTVANRIFYICSSNSTAEPTEGDLGLYKTTATNQSFTIVLTNETKQFYIYSNGAAYISSVVVTYASNSYQDYTISCSSENTITLDPNGGESWTTNEINTWQGPDANGCYTKSVEKNTTVVLPTPTKIGNQFAGWIDDAANPVSSPYTPNSNVTLTAQWTPNQHTLTWKLEGGTVTTEGTHAALGATGSPTGNVAYGTTITAPVVEREGYTFQGWHDGTGIVTPASTMPDNNLTYTAQWQVNTYTLTWHLTGGTVTTAGTCADVNATGSPTGNVAYGTTITAPVVEREGYNFAGWNPNPTGTMPAENVEYTAQWTAKRLTNFRTLCCKPLEAPTGLTATPSIKGGAVYWSRVTGATSYEVTYDGGNKWHTTNTNSYVIDGIECGHVNVTWQVRAIGDGTTYCDEGPASDEHTFQTSECACPDTYSFHYSNESVWNDDEIICFAPVTGDENNYLTENISLPYAQQYKVAWESKDQIKDVNADWSSVPTEFASNMPFYHKRDKKFGANPQNGNLGGGKGRFHVYHDSKSDNKFISFIPTGYTLNFGSGDEWTNYQTLNFLPKTSNWNETEWYTELITLTNDHLSKQLFVGLETENGYVWCDPYSEKTNLTGLRTKTGAGDNWVTDGMSTSYANKTGKFRIYADSGDKNWYITFVPHYQLHYNANGGSGSMPSLPTDAVSCEETDANRTVTVSSCIFDAPTGHYFIGWNTKADGTGTSYEVGDTHTLTGDITLYAQWSNLYTLDWDFQEGTPSNNDYTHAGGVAYGTTLTAPVLTRTGWTFVGWDPVVPATMPAQDVTYVAQWQVNTYTVTWNANGGKFGNETSVEQSYSYGATITAPADPTRTSYTFAGWDPAPAATMPASNLTYNAQWNCTSPTDIKINGAYIVFPGETIELTVTGNNIADNATYQWHKKNGENYDVLVGQTTATLTIPNCVVGDAANYKCVVTNGACSAENNFTVKMYRLRGLTDPENNWTTDFVFSKAEGKTATYEITLNGGSNYKFKVHDGSAYYGNNEGGDNPNPTMTHDNCTNWTMQENKGYNVILQTTITGVYTFVLDYTDESNPKISVIYPKKKIIYLNPNIWDAENATEYYTVYSWGTAGSKFEPMELADCNGEVYMAEIDAAHTQVIFIRYERHVTNFDHKWNQTVDIPLDANNPQYRIDGWENNSNDKKSYGGWEQYTPYYSISYNMNGHGQSIGDICIKKDDIWIAPDDPSEVGYTFLGWRRPAETGDNTLYKKGVTGFPVVSDEELTAQWSFSMEYAITGTANVTSAVGQTIKATTPLQLAVSNMPVGTKVAISAPNITFYDEAGNAITEVATKYNPEQFNLTIAYTPTVENTTEQPTITLSVLGNEKTFDGLISARSLPNIFAIVAKVGNIWYALPSQGLNSTDDLMGYAIEVDNQDDPTLVTNVPANADWSLRQVYAGQNANATKDRFKQYGNNLVFVNSDVKALNASSTGSHVLTDAQYTNYYDQYPERYEWTPTTTDLETYQLTNAGRTNRKLSIDILTRFGVYAGEITDMRFLRIQDRYTLAALQVVEWKENSVVIMYNGDPAQTATLAINGTEQVGTTTLNSVQKDIAIYELPANGIANKAAQRLCITIGTSKKWLTIPYIINGSQTAADVLTSTSTTKAVAAVTDVVVLDGATFTAAGNKNDKYTFRTIHVYGGGKLVVPASATEGLGIYSLILRSGTVENGTYTNSYPQLVMNGKYSNTSGIYLDYITTYERYYALSVPYPVKTKNIKYPADIYGDNLKSGNKASFALQYYDGAARATGASGWKDFDESGDDPTLTPYQGYTFWGAPRKVSVNGGTAQRPKFGIHRIQLTGVGAEALLESETKDKTIDITAHPADRPNDMGWNFLGNPYLAQYGGLSADNENVQVGLLEQEMVDGRWTGGWKHTGNLRYITITIDGQTYTPVEVDKATFSPFNTFFIQAAKDGALQFASASRAQNAPARHYAAQQETVKEITTGIILTGNDQTDRTGLLIADNFTEEYDFNADLSKFENSGINLYTIGKDGKLAFMAINQTLAEQPIPLGYGAPAEGLYTIAFDEDRYNATDISALYLIDYDSNEKTNLLHTDYSFVTAAGTNNQRFALQVAFAPENATNVEWVGDATIQVGVEGNTLMLNNLPTDATVHVFDALGRLMYHAPTVPTEMQLTLPTGYYLVRIADKQNAVVIKTVIP